MPNNPQDVHLQEIIGHGVEEHSVPNYTRVENKEGSTDYCLLQVSFRTGDLDRMLRFYQTVLELPNRNLDWRTIDSHRHCMLHMPYGQLLLVQDDSIDPQKAVRDKSRRFAAITFITGSDASVDRVYRRLQAMDPDCVVMAPFFDKDNRYKLIALDPDGNTVAFCD